MNDETGRWRAVERRKSGWTWAKEIIGTAVGVAGVMVLPIGWFLMWARDMEKVEAIHTVEIATLQAQRSEIVTTLIRMEDKMDGIRRDIRDVANDHRSK